MSTSFRSSPWVGHRPRRPSSRRTLTASGLVPVWDAFFLPPTPDCSYWLGGVKGFQLSTHKNTIQSQFLNPHKCNPKWIYGEWKWDNIFSPFFFPEGLSWEAILCTASVKIDSQNWKSVMLHTRWRLTQKYILNRLSLSVSLPPATWKWTVLNKTQVLLPGKPRLRQDVPSKVSLICTKKSRNKIL